MSGEGFNRPPVGELVSRFIPLVPGMSLDPAEFIGDPYFYITDVSHAKEDSASGPGVVHAIHPKSHPTFFHKSSAASFLLAFHTSSSGRTQNNIRELNGSQTQSIYVFNKYYLDLPLDAVLRELRVEAPLHPPIEEIQTSSQRSTPKASLEYFANPNREVANGSGVPLKRPRVE
ncbi:hypothetical protein B0H14DRAFT_3628727 [Mycena olivaceomarginata]|nr:hypothetical protein B0H14DRAFT_3628727 [Mycena olivaceomarginata]